MVNFIIMNNYLFNRKAHVTTFYEFDGPTLGSRKLGMLNTPDAHGIFVVWLAKVNNRGYTLEIEQLSGTTINIFLARGEWKLHQLNEEGLKMMLDKRKQELDLFLENI